MASSSVIFFPSANAVNSPANANYVEAYRYDAVTGNLAAKEPGAPTPPTAPNPGTTGLAAWWSLDETSGARSDSDGPNALTVSGTVGSTSDALKGKAATFSPTTPGSLRVNDNPQISTGDIDFTLVAHVYLNSSTGTTIIATKGEKSNMNNRDFTLAYSASAFSFRVGDGTDGGVVTSGTVSSNAWHTIVAWHDAQNDSLHIQVDNGTVNTVDEYFGDAADTTFPLLIGAFADNSFVFNGRIDEVALYKRTLTADERGWLFNNTQAQGRAYTETLPSSASAMTYGYSDSAHAHAVTHLNATQKYWYDQNGNQITRILGANTYTLSYDAENRLTSVTGPSLTASFVYDGDGKRVKSIINNGTNTETILFIGGHYEFNDTTDEVTKYYFAGTQRATMRKYIIPQSSTLNYLLGDHLGSTSIVTSDTGALLMETRYKPCPLRYTSGVLRKGEIR